MSFTNVLKYGLLSQGGGEMPDYPYFSFAETQTNLSATIGSGRYHNWYKIGNVLYGNNNTNSNPVTINMYNLITSGASQYNTTVNITSNDNARVSLGSVCTTDGKIVMMPRHGDACGFFDCATSGVSVSNSINVSDCYNGGTLISDNVVWGNPRDFGKKRGIYTLSTNTWTNLGTAQADQTFCCRLNPSAYTGTSSLFMGTDYYNKKTSIISYNGILQGTQSVPDRYPAVVWDSYGGYGYVFASNYIYRVSGSTFTQLMANPQSAIGYAYFFKGTIIHATTSSIYFYDTRDMSNYQAITGLSITPWQETGSRDFREGIEYDYTDTVLTYYGFVYNSIWKKWDFTLAGTL